MNKSHGVSTESSKPIVIDYETGVKINYDYFWYHTKPEDGFISLYNDGFGDSFRTIYKIKKSDGNFIWVKEFMINEKEYQKRKQQMIQSSEQKVKSVK